MFVGPFHNVMFKIQIYVTYAIGFKLKIHYLLITQNWWWNLVFLKMRFKYDKNNSVDTTITFGVH